jgi:hypothetical protein
LKKTDGQSGELAGVKLYELDFEATAEFIENAMYAVGDAIQVTRPGPTLSQGFSWDAWFNTAVGGRKPATRGDKLLLKGSVRFERKESGWVPTGVSFAAEVDTSRRNTPPSESPADSMLGTARRGSSGLVSSRTKTATADPGNRPAESPYERARRAPLQLSGEGVCATASPLVTETPPFRFSFTLWSCQNGERHAVSFIVTTRDNFEGYAWESGSSETEGLGGNLGEASGGRVGWTFYSDRDVIDPQGVTLVHGGRWLTLEESR